MEFGTRERWGAAIAVTVVTLGSVGAWMSQRPPANANGLPAPPASIAVPDSSATPKVLEFNAGEAPPAPAATAESPQATPSPTPAPTPTPKTQLVVYVSGAVKKPGVYTFQIGDRIYHAIRAAGGLKPNADPEALNLAEYLRDADNIHFPVKRAAATTFARPSAPVHPLITRGTSPTATNETPATPDPPQGRVLGKESPPVAVVGTASPEGASSSTRGASGGKSSTKSNKLRTPGEGSVNINMAGIEELQKLPGVGPALAQRIIDHRQQIGRFNTPEQLKDVKGIGTKTYAKMQPFLRVE